MSDDHLPKWKTASSKHIIKDRWISLRADTVIMPDGRTLDPWYVLEYPDFITCMAIDTHGDVITLLHYRYGANVYSPELVSGIMEEDASPDQLTRRELLEEIGYEGGELYRTGSSYANPSNQTNKVHSFLAVGGDCTGERIDELGSTFTIRKTSFAEFVRTMTTPNPQNAYQALHLAGIFFCLNYIRNTHAPSGMLADLQQQLRAIEKEDAIA